MTTTEHGWTMDVDRGPDWLFVRLRGESPRAGAGRAALAEEIFELMQQSFTRRIVLEMDQIERLNSAMLGQLVSLSKRVREIEGTLRLAGLSPDNERVLETTQLDGRIPAFPTRGDAVRGERPKPR